MIVTKLILTTAYSSNTNIKMVWKVKLTLTCSILTWRTLIPLHKRSIYWNNLRNGTKYFMIFWEPGWKLVYFINSFYLANGEFFRQQVEFSIWQLHLISESDPLQACRFGRFVLFGEWKFLFMTRQVEFQFVRFDEWKILCSIWHIVFFIRKLHLISNNDPLQVSRFGRFVSFVERIILFTTWQVEFPSYTCIL